MWIKANPLSPQHLYFDFLIKILVVYERVSACVHMLGVNGCPRKTEEGVRSPGGGVTG